MSFLDSYDAALPDAASRGNASSPSEATLQFLNDRLDLIARVTGVVIGAAPLAEQTRELAEQVRRAFGVDACVVRTLDGEDLVQVAGVGIPAESLQSRIPVHWGISREILARRCPIAIRDVTLHPATAPYVGTLPNSYRFCSYAGAPLLVEDHVVGILGIYTCDTCRDFTETDMEHLQIVANHIAVALVNGRLYREIQNQKERLEAEFHARRQLEEQLLQAQKMEGIGRMAGGIAHDFNNLLTAIIGYTELAEFEATPDSPLSGYLQAAQQAAQRAAALTQQLLAFARKQITEPRVIDLNDLIFETDKLFRRLIGEDIELVTTPNAQPGWIKADPSQMIQVLVNLAVNARDAMPHGGRLSIETANITLSLQELHDHPEMTPGKYVLLAVRDTGAGMDEAVQARIFEPFFTTKELGKGTGLGLATCYGIVQQSGGLIQVRSAPGEGTLFQIYLPCVEETSPAPSPHTTALQTGEETLLVVEDEPLVRELTVQILQSLGYFVLEAANGSEALLLAREYANPIHLLVTDVIMPHLSGKMLSDRLQALRPDIKTLYVSGYTDDALGHHGVLEEGMEFLQKPFTPGALARRIREILDRG